MRGKIPDFTKIEKFGMNKNEKKKMSVSRSSQKYRLAVKTFNFMFLSIKTVILIQSLPWKINEYKKCVFFFSC